MNLFINKIGGGSFSSGRRQGTVSLSPIGLPKGGLRRKGGDPRG